MNHLMTTHPTQTADVIFDNFINRYEDYKENPRFDGSSIIS